MISVLNINIQLVSIIHTSNMSQTHTQTHTKIQELLDDEPNYRNIRVSEATVKRLQEKASRYRDSYETIINRILDEKEGKEVNLGERSF